MLRIVTLASISKAIPKMSDRDLAVILQRISEEFARRYSPSGRLTNVRDVKAAGTAAAAALDDEPVMATAIDRLNAAARRDGYSY